MTWKPMDFKSLATLGKPLIDHLDEYLDEKESYLAHQIIISIHPIPGMSFPPALSPAPGARMKIADAVENFGKTIRQIAVQTKPMVPIDDWKVASNQINEALANHVYLLEDCTIELFRQLERLRIDDWQRSLIEVLDTAKADLMHRVEEMIWAIIRLEKLLKEYRRTCLANESFFVRFKNSPPFQRLLDRALISKLHKCEKLLLTHYNYFHNEYISYLELKEKTDATLPKFASYHILGSLEKEPQDIFKKLYQLLHLWQYNRKSKLLPESDILQPIFDVASQNKILATFKNYFQAIQFQLFERSRIFKKNRKEVICDTLGKSLMLEVIASNRAELKTLDETVQAYRDVISLSDDKKTSNPVVKELSGLVLQFQNVNALFTKLEEVLLDQNAPSFDMKRGGIEAKQLLKEMSQPMASYAMVRKKADRLLHLIHEVDEFGSFQFEAIDFVGEILTQALRADWKYHVLPEMPAFNQYYAIHEGLLGAFEDRSHHNRYNKFKELLEQVEQWVKNRDISSHIQEIELDINDIKGYLQDFLAYVQRSCNDSSIASEAKNQLLNNILRQLLEYRYLFGSFFCHLRQHEPEGRQIRNQFLFVDQYFQSVDNILERIQN